MLITKDSNDRVRINGQSLRRNVDRWFTHQSFRILINLHAICVLLFVTVNSHRSIKDSGCVARQNFWISVPLIDIRNTRNTLVNWIHHSGQLNLSTFADLCQRHDDAVDFRSVVYDNQSTVVSNTSRHVTILCQITNLNNVVGCCINISSIVCFGSTRNQIVIWNGVGVPLVLQFVVNYIVIIQMRNECNLAACTYGISIRSNVDYRRSHDGNLKRFWPAWASATINNFNLEGIIVTVSCSETTQEHSTILCMIRILFEHTISVPSVDSASINSTINPSIQQYIVFSKSTVANEMLTTDNNMRITTNFHSVWMNSSRNWIAIRIIRFVNFYSIYIFVLVMIKDCQLFHKSVTVNTFDNYTITSPLISNSRVNVMVAGFIFQISSNLNTCAFANIVCGQSIILVIAISIVNIILQIGNCNTIKNRILNSNNSVATSTLAVTVQLSYNNLESGKVRICNCISQSWFSTFSYKSSIINIPLISQVGLIVVAKVSSQVNQLVLTYGIIINRNNNLRLIFDVQIERFADYLTIWTLIQHHGNFVWIISIRQISLKYIRGHWGRINAINSPLILYINARQSVAYDSQQTNSGRITNHRITIDNNRRISASGHNVRSGGNVGFTLGLISCTNFDKIISGIQIKSSRWENEMITWNGHQFETINEPTISGRNSIATEVLFSVSGILYIISNLTTDTNCWIAGKKFDRLNCGILREHINNCVGPSFTLAVHLFNSYIVSSILTYGNSQSSTGSNSNCIRIAIIRFSIVPLIYQVGHIVVSKVSDQSSFFTSTYGSIADFNSNRRIDTDQYIVNIADYLASRIMVNYDSNFVRIISLRKCSFKMICVLANGINAVNSPQIGNSLSNQCVMNCCIQTNSWILAKDRIARNHNWRISMDSHHRVILCIYNGAGGSMDSSDMNGVIGRVIVHSLGWENEDTVAGVSHNHTINRPLISSWTKQSVVCCVDSSESHLCAIASISLVNIQDKLFSICGIGIHGNHRVTSSKATAVHLLNSYVETCAVCKGHGQFSAGTGSDGWRIKSFKILHWPLVNQIRHVVITKVSSQHNFFGASTNDRCANTDSNSRIVANQDTIHIAFRNASATSVNHNCDFIRIISLRQSCTEHLFILANGINAVNSPQVLYGRTRYSVMYCGIQNNCWILTDNRIARNHNRRTFHNHDVLFNCRSQNFTSGGVGCCHYHIVYSSVGTWSCGNEWIGLAFYIIHFNTIHCPHIGTNFTIVLGVEGINQS